MVVTNITVFKLERTMKIFKKVILFANFVVLLPSLLFLSAPSTAYAYTDPGSGLLLWQLLGSVFIGLSFYFRRIIAFIKGLLHKNDQ